MKSSLLVAIRVLAGVVGGVLVIGGVWVVASAWSVRGSVNELQEAFAVLLATTVCFLPGAALVLFAARGRSRSEVH